LKPLASSGFAGQGRFDYSLPSPKRDIATEFLALNDGLLAVRKKLGEERYATLRALSDKMRALFEADPEDRTGDTQAGREVIHEMEDILRSANKRRGSK
jgi:hypothetical protein